MYLRSPLKGNTNPFPGRLLLKKIERRLSTWSSCYTSKRERLTLIQATLSTLPIYYMSLFEMPQKMASDVDRLFRNYLWKDDPYLVRWTKKGGLGPFSIKKNKSEWNDRMQKLVRIGGLDIHNLCLTKPNHTSRWPMYKLFFRFMRLLFSSPLCCFRQLEVKLNVRSTLIQSNTCPNSL